MVLVESRLEGAARVRVLMAMRTNGGTGMHQIIVVARSAGIALATQSVVHNRETTKDNSTANTDNHTDDDVTGLGAETGALLGLLVFTKTGFAGWRGQVRCFFLRNHAVARSDRFGDNHKGRAGWFGGFILLLTSSRGWILVTRG